MSNPHLNIFHAYRGPSRTEDAQLRQLEDNLTRALIITIDRIQSSSAVSNNLLKALGVCEENISSSYQCYMQVSQSSTSWPAKLKRHLLILHGGPVLAIGSGKSDATSARLDGLISSPDFLLGIESKIGNWIDESQIERHCRLLGIDRDQVTDLTWSRLAREVSKIGQRPLPDNVASFVVEEFEEYLRMNGFGGFSAEHFSYFALPQPSRDDLVKEGIRRVLGEHAEMIASLLGSGWKTRVLNIHAGVPDSGAVIEPGQSGQDPHVTLVIDPSSLSILANIELARAYRRFMRTWKSNPTQLIELIRDLGQERVTNSKSVPWKLGIKRRVPLGPPRQYHYWQSTDLALSSMVDWPDSLMLDVLGRLFTQPENEAVPQIFFMRSYPTSLVLQHGDVSEWLLRDTEQLKPAFQWLQMDMAS